MEALSLFLGNGQISFFQKNESSPVLINFNMNNLLEGRYKFQIHGFGGSSNVAYYKPLGQEYGDPKDKISSSCHRDIGPFEVGADGCIKLNFVSERISLHGPLTIIGCAAVIHADPDRRKEFLCGVISLPKSEKKQIMELEEGLMMCMLSCQELTIQEKEANQRGMVLKELPHNHQEMLNDYIILRSHFKKLLKESEEAKANLHIIKTHASKNNLEENVDNISKKIWKKLASITTETIAVSNLTKKLLESYSISVGMSTPVKDVSCVNEDELSVWLSENMQPTVNPNAPGRQEDQLKQVISNIMMSLNNHAPTQGAQTPPGVTVFTSSGDDSGSRDGSALFNAIREITQEASRAAMRQNTASTPSTDLSTAMPADIYQETLRLFNTLEMSNMKVAEILTSIDFRTEECNVLLGEDPSDADIDPGVKQKSSEILSRLQSFVSATKSHCGMDYSAALSTFIHQSVRKLLIIILDKTEDADKTFRMRSVCAFQDISKEFLALNEKYSFNARERICQRNYNFLN